MITLPFSKLRAAALFASRDELRFILNGVHVHRLGSTTVLLVATDGRRMAGIRHQVSAPLPEFEPFTIPVSLIQRADPCVAARVYNAVSDAVGLGDEPEWLGDLHADAEVVLDIDADGCSLACRGVVVSAKTQEAQAHNRFPRWDQVFGQIHGEINPKLCLSAHLLKDFARAEELLSPPKCGGLLITGYQKNPDTGQAAVVAITIPSVPDFAGVLMPVKEESGCIACMPDWLKGAKS
jgi:hypothetical protein